MQVKEFTDPQPLMLFMDSDQYGIQYMCCLNEHQVEVHVNTTIFGAAFTMCWACLRLYKALELLGDQGGLKNNGYKCNDGKVARKVHGFSLNAEGAAKLNYNVLQQNTMDKLRRPLEVLRKTCIHQAQKIIRKSKEYTIHTQPANKDYQLVFDKRMLDPMLDNEGM